MNDSLLDKRWLSQKIHRITFITVRHDEKLTVVYGPVCRVEVYYHIYIVVFSSEVTPAYTFLLWVTLLILINSKSIVKKPPCYNKSIYYILIGKMFNTTYMAKLYRANHCTGLNFNCKHTIRLKYLKISPEQNITDKHLKIKTFV